MVMLTFLNNAFDSSTSHFFVVSVSNKGFISTFIHYANACPRASFCYRPSGIVAKKNFSLSVIKICAFYSRFICIDPASWSVSPVLYIYWWYPHGCAWFTKFTWYNFVLSITRVILHVIFIKHVHYYIQK